MAPRSTPRWRRHRALKKDGTAGAWPGRQPRVLEKTEQAHIHDLLTKIGWTVYTLGTRRRRGKSCPSCGTFVPEDQGTRQSPGLADLFAFSPMRSTGGLKPHRTLLVVECKTETGRMSSEQEVFRHLCLDAEVEHVVGTYNAVIAWLVWRGWVRAEQFPHYRQPAVPVVQENR